MLRTTPELIQPAIDQSVDFIKQCFAKAGKTQAVVAVSGGIDSAVTLTLATKALGAEAITALLLPYGEQDMADARTICDFNQLPASNIQVLNIKPIVTVAAQALELSPSASQSKLRLGNLMARTRMMLVFDQAKKIDGLVCGTENLTENYLGYFTRFGDEASDLEPIASWFKTEVRAAAENLNLPPIFTTKAPTAGLWPDQTDEKEFGFSYAQADLILALWQAEGKSFNETYLENLAATLSLPLQTIKMVLEKVKTASFKHETPYKLQ